MSNKKSCSIASSSKLRLVTFVAFLFLLAGCSQEMENQRRVQSQEATDAFADGVASRPLPEHTISASTSAREMISVAQLQPSRHWLDQRSETNANGYLTGKVDDRFVDEIPSRILNHFDYRTLLELGRERFNVSCTPCHDRTGSGNGMVARRGLKFPPSYHTNRLRAEPLGYIFNVATYGHGKMPAYGDFLSTDDRWAIAAYVRALQLSQYVPTNELSASDLAKMSPPSQAEGHSP